MSVSNDASCFGQSSAEKLIAQLRSNAFIVTNAGLHQLVDSRFPELLSNGALAPTPAWYYERIIEVLDDLREHYQELIRAWDKRLEVGTGGKQDQHFDELAFRFRHRD